MRKPIKDQKVVEPDEYDWVRYLDERKDTAAIGDVGERIVARMLNAWGRGDEMFTTDKPDQLREMDIIYPYVGEEGQTAQAYEVKVDRLTFGGQYNRRYSWGKSTSERLYGAFCGSILGGTGNLFIEEVQYAPAEWGDKEPTEEQIRSLKDVDRGWMQVIRENPIEHPRGKAGRLVWFVPYMGYVEGRRQLIISIPDDKLIDLIEAKKGSLRWSKTTKKKDGQDRITWGRLLPIKDLFEFEVVDPNADDPYKKAHFYYTKYLENEYVDEQHPCESGNGYMPGAASKNGSNAVAYLWDVDQGEDGYTTMKKAAPELIQQIEERNKKAELIVDVVNALIEAGSSKTETQSSSIV